MLLSNAIIGDIVNKLKNLQHFYFQTYFIVNNKKITAPITILINIIGHYAENNNWFCIYNTITKCVL